MSALEFIAPPARARWVEEASELRARSGEWAVLTICPTPEKASAFASTVRGGRRSAFAPAGSFDAVARKVDGECRVYARYVGEAS